MSFLSDLGNTLIKGATGSSLTDIQSQAAQAEQQLSIAISTMIALQAIVAVELFVLVVMAFKERHG